MSEDELRQKLENIAKMRAYDLPAERIAQILNTDEGTIEKILATEQYKEIHAEVLQAELVDKVEVDEGWDSLEKRSLEVLNKTLDWTHDPELALKAASVANKAIRRMKGNDPLSAPASVGVVALTLNANFVQAIENNGGKIEETSRDEIVKFGAKKQVQFLAPDKVKSLMTDGKSEAMEILDAGIDDAMSDMND